MWEAALNCKGDKSYFGALWYLIKFQILCPYYYHIVQFCIDNNRVTELLLFLNPEYKFRNKHGVVFVLPYKLPTLDVACERGYLLIVKLIMLFFRKDHLLLLHHPDQTINKVINSKNVEILKLMIPEMAEIKKSETLIEASSDTDLFLFLLHHLRGINLLTEQVLISLANFGHLDLLKLCLKRGASMTQKVWDQAFLNNFTHITEGFPQFQMTDSLLEKACKLGKMNVIENFSLLPDKCLLASIKSGNARLIHLVAERVKNPVFTKNMLLKSISKHNYFIDEKETDPVNIDPVLAVFYRGGFIELDDNIKKELVIKNKQSTLDYFHEMDVDGKLGFDVYNDVTFLQAAQCCNIDIMKRMLTLPNMEWSNSTLAESSRLIYISQFDDKMKRLAFLLIESARKLVLTKVD
jgi:hypothetical protein